MSTIAGWKQSPRSSPRHSVILHAWRAVETSWREQRSLLVSTEARRGGLWGISGVLTLFFAVRLLYLPSGFGLAFDAALLIAATAIVITLIALVVAGVLTLIRNLPLAGTGVFVGACLLLTLGWFSTPSLSLVAIVIALCLAACVFGAVLAAYGSSWRRHSPAARTVAALVLVAAGTYVIGFAWSLAGDGDLEKLSSWRPHVELMPPTLSAPNPGSRGPHTVRTLFYGSGTDLRRREYNADVAIRTRTVDASAFFRGYEGWARWARSRFWGFDIDALPLNARAWYPEGDGPFPLVLIAHGNHRMNDFSDPGYEYLGQLLASRGFILASVDQNFLNGTPGFREPTATPLPTGREQAVRGWHLLEHLRMWHEWNGQPGNPFYRKVDVNRVALMGHSRGGEAAATAALFNRMQYYPEDASVRFAYGYALQAIVAIAPADGQYQPAQQLRWVEDVSYLTLHGAHDADQASFTGSRQADRVRFTRPGPAFSAEIWAYRANHGQFNTTWGRSDFPPPLGWFLNVEPLMDGDDQRRISKTYIAAFLETVLNDRREYLPLFKDWRTGREWLPETIYINRYRDASYIPLATFQEDADLTTTTARGGAMDGEGLTLWREGRIPTRRGDRGYNGVFLGWFQKGGAPAVYSLSLPENAALTWPLADRSTVELSVAALDQNAPAPPDVNGLPPGQREAPDFTIELVANDGTIAAAPVSRFAEIPPPLKEKFTKFDYVESDRYGRDWEPVFQTVRAPLSAFVGRAGTPFDRAKLTQVRLKFDRTTTGVICISSIGFGLE